VLGLHVTPEPLRPVQSPLAAYHPAPGLHDGQLNPTSWKDASAPPRQGSALLRPEDGRTFQRLKLPGSISMKPHGSSSTLVDHSVWFTRAQHRGLPGQQSTPDRQDRPVSPELCSGARCCEADGSFLPRDSRGRSPSSRESSHETLPLLFAWNGARSVWVIRRPCKSGLAEPPGHLLDCREPRTGTAESVHSRCANRTAMLAGKAIEIVIPDTLWKSAHRRSYPSRDFPDGCGPRFKFRS